MARDEQHGIRLPGVILDQIRGVEDDARFADARGKKRAVGRKQRRKEERENKRHKHSKPTPPGRGKAGEKTSGKMGLTSSKETKRSVKAAPSMPKPILKEPKHKGTGRSVQFAGGSDDSASDFGGFSDRESSGDEAVLGLSDDSLDPDDFDNEEEEDGPQTAEEVMAALKAMKGKKAGKSAQAAPPPMQELEILSDDSLDSDDFDDEVEEGEGEEDGPRTAEEVMAALRALKSGKAIAPSDDSLDSDDFDEEEEPGEDQPQTPEDVMAALKAMKAKKQATATAQSAETDVRLPSAKSSHKPMSRIDPHTREQMLRDDADMEYYAKKLGIKNGKLTKQGDDDVIGGLLDGLELDFDSDSGASATASDADVPTSQLSDQEYNRQAAEIRAQLPWSDDSVDSDDFDLDEESDEGPREKENPYVAPVAAGAYVPPALRKKTGDNEVALAITRKVRGSLNKLLEANIALIVLDVVAVYGEFPRQSVTECLTLLVVDAVVSQGRLQDLFVLVYCALVAALYRTQGVEFGAYFVQTLVERLDLARAQNDAHACTNLASLVAGCYLLQVVLSQLVYDIIRELVVDITELNTEILLKLVRSGGNQMRSDDPLALKEIIGEVQAHVGPGASARTKFLVDTIVRLKNNKVRGDEALQQLVTRMRKVLAGIGKGDAIAVGLRDIREVELRGKWWLVGAAWRGHSEAATPSNAGAAVPMPEVDVNDILDAAEPDWSELARSQRMNTDVRRAVFVLVMLASDYIDAAAKVDKLGLSRAQKREVPLVLVHCALIEPVFNPYYAVLAAKLCEDHGIRKQLQFGFWNYVAELEEGDDEGDAHIRKLLNLGRFYGFLLGKSSLGLHVLDDVKFVGGSDDVLMFGEMMMATFMDALGKQCKKGGRFDEEKLVERWGLVREHTTLLRALPRFLKERVRNSQAVEAKHRKRVQWAVDASCDVIEGLME